MVGKLLEEYKQTWADYIVKYLKEYKSLGINISYMTIQNEPKAQQTWESCIYTAEEEANFIKDYLSPTLKKYNINTKLLIWDHNKERLFYRTNTIAPIVKDIISGVGYHYYSGDHFENLELVRKTYPEYLLLHTEGCTGYSRYSRFFNKKKQITNAEIYAHDIIGDLNAGSNGYIDWNMVLDYYGGPNHKLNYCNAPIMINKSNTGYNKTLPFYYIGHFSKYIKPGAKRIAFSKFSDKIEVTSFINVDGTISVILLNKNNYAIKYNINIGNSIYTDIIQAHSIITLKIKE